MTPHSHDLPEAVARLVRSHDPAHNNAVDAHDLVFLNWVLSRERPGLVIEIGTASGLSAAAMALMLDDLGCAQSRIWTADLRGHCYWDTTKPVGYVLGELPAPLRARITQETGITALDAPDRFAPRSVGIAFVDASHQHPWPLIDTLCLLPLMRAGSPIVHHDLQLYLSLKNRVGVGPKLLYDQLAPDSRISPADLELVQRDASLPMRAVRDNIFALTVGDDIGAQGVALARAFCLPWTITAPLDPGLVARFRGFLTGQFPPQVARCFEIGLERDQVRRPPRHRSRWRQRMDRLRGRA